MFAIGKDGQNVLTVDDEGNVSFARFYRESDAGSVKPGELRVAFGASTRLSSAASSGGRDLRLARRLFEYSVLPNKGLQVSHPSSGAVAEIGTDGNLYLKHTVSSAPANPAAPGPFGGFQQIVYAGPGLDYPDDSDFDEYRLFENPTPGYSTRRLDVSDLAKLSVNTDWSFDETNVPLNGVLRVPPGAGPFPLFVIAHGQHNKFSDNSTLGYVYLLDLLASEMQMTLER